VVKIVSNTAFSPRVQINFKKLYKQDCSLQTTDTCFTSQDQMSKFFTLYVQDLRQDCNVHSVEVRWHSKIKDVKDLLHSITGITPSRQQLFQANCPIPLSSSVTLHCLSIDRSGYTLRLSIIETNVIGAAEFILNHAQESSLDKECSSILTDIRSGLQRENMPIKTDVLDCTGGVYFMRASCGRKVAVFKPFDEEQGMPNNTKGYHGTGELGLRQFTKPGYGCVRELAAYVMDVGNFCRVPPTMLVHCEHPVLNYYQRNGVKCHPYPKLGSLQKFIHACDTFEDVGASLLSDLEVQKVALLDLRLLNGDRNASNILAIRKKNHAQDGCTCCNSCSNSRAMETKESHVSSDAGEDSEYELVPIDHGYCLPSRLLIHELDWAWFYYPQVNRPVHEVIKQYLRELDLDALLVSMLSHVSLPEESIFLAKISHQLVVDGVAAGLNLFEIATIVARVKDHIPSSLERAIEEAEENAYRTIEMRLAALSRSPRTSTILHKTCAGTPTWSPSRQPSCSAEVETKSDCINDKADQETSRVAPPRPGCFPSKHRSASLSSIPGTFNAKNEDGKTVRFLFDNPLTRLEEITGLTDSSGTNTPSVKGESGPSSPDRDQICNDAAQVDQAAPTSMSYDEEEKLKCTSSDSLSSHHHPCGFPTLSRLPFTDADKALECRIGSPSSVLPQKGLPLQSVFSSIDAVEDCCIAPLPYLQSGRMKRVNTLNQVALPMQMISTASLENSSSSFDRRTDIAVVTNLRLDDESEERLHIPTPLRREDSRGSKDLAFSMSKDSPLASNSIESEVIGQPSRRRMNTYSGDSQSCEDDDPYTTDVDGSPLSSPSSPTARASTLSFLRVTSFSAFSSAPIYDAEGAERRLGKLQKERRRQVAMTEEFTRIRLLFAQNSVSALISKAVRSKMLV
jgi:Phosphatidylinositol 3- and 4-kinase